MRKLRYTFKSDILFKMVFVKYPHLLKELVAVILGITVENITAFEILNSEITPESIEDKFCRLDINMRVNGKLVDIEMQVANEGNYPERVMFYWAREFSSALVSGADYSLLPATIIISIMDFNLFGCEEYHSFFQPREVTRHTLLSDKMGFHFFELPKLPELPENANENSILLLWLSLFNASTEEELEKLNQMEVPVMSEAINAYYSVANSSEYREIEKLRDKARHDEAQALRSAEQRGVQQGIKQGVKQGVTDVALKLLKRNRPIDEIMEDTGLTYSEIEELRSTIHFS